MDPVSANFAKLKTKTSFSLFQIIPIILEFYNTFSSIELVSLVLPRNFPLLVLHFLKLEWPSKNLNFSVNWRLSSGNPNWQEGFLNICGNSNREYSESQNNAKNQRCNIWSFRKQSVKLTFRVLEDASNTLSYLVTSLSWRTIPWCGK